MNKTIAFHVFQNGITSTSTGTVYNIPVDGVELINIAFDLSSGGSFSATFQARVDLDNSPWVSIGATDLCTADISQTATDATHLYQMYIGGIAALRVNVTSIDGTLSCYGKIIG